MGALTMHCWSFFHYLTLPPHASALFGLLSVLRVAYVVFVCVYVRGCVCVRRVCMYGLLHLFHTEY